MRILFFILNLFFVCDLFSQVVINEVMYENHISMNSQCGKTSDWIEIYNAGVIAQNISGWGLSDNAEKPLKWQFPDITIQPGEYRIIYASGMNILEDTLHTNFKLGQMEEPVLLSHPDGNIADRFDPQCVPSDKSAARLPDGIGSWIITNTPSPGSSNKNSLLYNVNYMPDSLISSQKSGFYTHPFNLELKNSILENTIFYTTNGKEPDEQSLRFDSAIYIKDRSDDPNYFSEIDPCDNYVEPRSSVFKATIIRARVYSDGCPASDMVNLTYLVHPHMNERYNVPVVSVFAERDDFFSDETGIYVRGDHNNFIQTGDDWERKIHLQIFDNSGTVIIDQDAGARIHGRGTRQSAQKSLRLYADDKYGKTSFDYPFFNDRELESYRRLILKTTRGDWLGTLFTDILCHELVKDMNIDYMSGITTIVFLNGEYWGIQTLRERQDEKYLMAHHAVRDSLYDIVDYVPSSGPVVESGTLKSYEDLVALLNNNYLADDELYSFVDKRVDLGNMIDFFIAEIYLGNVDFPSNNHTMWRPASEEGQWRWFFYDCDACFFRFNYDHMFDYFNEIDMYQRYPDWSMAILSRMLQNWEFSTRFMQRFFQVMNTDFAPERVITKIDSLKTIYQPLMAEHIERWNDPEDISSWLYYVERMKQYAIGRPLEVTEQLLKYFGNPVNVYPNPASDYIILKSELFVSGDFQVRIFDMMGREVAEYDFKGEGNEVELSLDSNLPEGLYLMNIYTGFYIQSQKLSINHD